jgi:hypothetical protein
MPSLDDVYRKFGDVAEAAQLLETELGNVLLLERIEDEFLLENKNIRCAREIFEEIDRQTLGQLIRSLNQKGIFIDNLENLLSIALKERNRLLHSFYRQHNFRRNSDDGRKIMLDDLESIHLKLLSAYKAIMLLSGIDLDANVIAALPTRHIPI